MLMKPPDRMPMEIPAGSLAPQAVSLFVHGSARKNHSRAISRSYASYAARLIVAASWLRVGRHTNQLPWRTKVPVRAVDGAR